jgi:hypothetical protein
MRFVGFLLSVIGAILVILYAVLGVPDALNHLASDIAPMITIVLLFVLAIIAIILAFRMRAVKDSFFPLILIIVAVVIMWRTAFMLFPLIGSILIILGAIIVLIARN